MKISPESYKILEDACNEVLDSHPGVRQEYQSKDLTEKRFRWDILWAAKINAWVCDVLYAEENMTDEHIDTALRRIVGGYDGKV